MNKDLRIWLILLVFIIGTSCNLSRQIDVEPVKTEVSLRTGIKDSVWFAQGKPIDYYRYDTLKSTIKDLPEVLVYSLYGLPQLTNVGDIDGDGFDEIGFFSTAYESNWSNYDVYSVKNGRWYELKEKPYVFILGYQELNPRPKIIEAAGNGRIKILKMKFDDIAIVCDTIIKPIFELLPDAKDHAFKDSLLSLIDAYYEEPDELKDSVLITFLSSANSFDRILDNNETHRLRVSVSEDKRARLITIPGRGTMTWGESYIQYHKNDSTIILKKIAYSEPMEEGGVAFPALFIELHNKPDASGYEAYGVFSFNTVDEVFHDTLFISKEFVESNTFVLRNDFRQ